MESGRSVPCRRKRGMIMILRVVERGGGGEKATTAVALSRDAIARIFFMVMCFSFGESDDE